MPQPGSATETEGKIVKCSEDQSMTGRKRESTVFRFTLPLISFCNPFWGKNIFLFLPLSLTGQGGGGGGLVT